MGKAYTGQPFALGFEPKITKPLDTREVVNTISDIYLPSTWLNADGNYYVYPGMSTRAQDTGKTAVYIGRANNSTDIADTSKWVIIGGSDYTHKCLTEAQMSALTASSAKEGVIYMSLEDWDGTGEEDEEETSTDTALFGSAFGFTFGGGNATSASAGFGSVFGFTFGQ